MSINMEGLIQTVQNAERAAASAVNGLNANSTVTDLTRANHRMNIFPMVVTAVTNALKADSEAKMAPTRAMAPR